MRSCITRFISRDLFAVSAALDDWWRGGARVRGEGAAEGEGGDGGEGEAAAEGAGWGRTW